MKRIFLTGAATVALMAGLASISPVRAQQAAPAANPMASPPMGGAITANPHPYGIDLGPILGKTYITGAITGMGFVQNNSTTGGNPAHRDTGADLTNGMVEIQKTDGMFQYFIQAGI